MSSGDSLPKDATGQGLHRRIRSVGLSCRRRNFFARFSKQFPSEICLASVCFKWRRREFATVIRCGRPVGACAFTTRRYADGRM